MIIGALILTVISLSLTVIAGHLSANNLSPFPAILAVISSVLIIAALALVHGSSTVNIPDPSHVIQETGK